MMAVATPPSAAKKRSTLVHVIRFVAGWLAFQFAVAVPGMLAAAIFPPSPESASITPLLTLAAVVGLGGYIASKVGYRQIDGLLLLIPVASIYFFFKWMWRYASLPFEYWANAYPSALSPPVPPPPPLGDDSERSQWTEVWRKVDAQSSRDGS